MKLLVALLIAALSMQSSLVNANFYNGTKIYEKCTSVEVSSKSFCTGWIIGTFDSLLWRKRPSNNQFFCLRGGVSIRQLKATFLKFLNDHPEKWNVEASALFELSLARAFPCKEN